MDFQTYSPAKVTFSFMGQDITGYQDGTFIDVERAEDSFTKHVGSRGDVTRTQNLNRSGKITLTLMAQSPANDLLQARLQLDEQFGTEFGPLYIKDLSGNMRCRATIAWIMKPPKVERAKESGPCVWVFECADLFINAGGNVL